MIRGEYEAYSGHSHLSAPARRQAGTGREDRCCYSQKAIDDYIPARRQAGLPAGRLEEFLLEQSRILN